MPWVRLDDGYPEHPKVDRVGPLAAWLNVCAWAYCARNLTDGFVPAERVARLAQVPKPQQLADRLVDATLWETVDGGYRVHDYLTYNPSREQILKERAATADRVAGWRERRKATRQRVTNGVTNGVTPPVGNAVSNGGSTPAPGPDPAPELPVPSERPSNQPTKGKRRPITDSQIDQLIKNWAERFGGGELVRDEIDAALNHQARFKCIDEHLYVARWLGRQLEFRASRGSSAVNGRPPERERHIVDRTGQDPLTRDE